MHIVRTHSILSAWRGFAIAMVLSLVATLTAYPARSAELVMFESATCSWCARWHQEIGPVYPNTSEARCAPLRRVDINTPRPDDLKDIDRIVFTPTFVLVHDGVEISRMVGYPGEDFFWPLLADHHVKLPQGCQN